MPNRQHHRSLPFRIYAITDRKVLTKGTSLVQAAADLLVAAPAGRVALQLRDKDLPQAERAELARQLRAITRRHGALLLINGDLELATSCGADGIHFADGHPGLQQISATERGWGRDRLWVGASCHDRAGIERAQTFGADFITLSPVQPSPGKAEPGQELGWSRFAELSEATDLPTFALGGLGPDNAEQASQAGAYGVAAIRSMWKSAQPREHISMMLEPFAPVGSGARGGRLGRALSSGLALLLTAFLGACSTPGAMPDDDDSARADDDDSAAEPSAVPIDIPLPDSPFALECESAEPDDIDIPLGRTNIIDPPWPQATNCGQVPVDAGGPLIHIRGSIQDLVGGTWNGDNDSFLFTLGREVLTRGVLRWEPLQGDFDARVLCQQGGNWRDLFGHQLATAALAESADAEFAIEAGTSCWVVIVGFSGLVGSYDFWLEEIEPG